MKKLKGFSLCFFLLSVNFGIAQYTFSGKVVSSTNKPIFGAEVYTGTGDVVLTDEKGEFTFSDLPGGDYIFVVYNSEYQILEEKISIPENSRHNFILQPSLENLSEVIITARKQKLYALRQLNPVEGTAIYAGKKTEVVLLDQVLGNIASNNPRQIYNQVVGLNIYDYGDAGLQLNIGGRGLDPNRSQNFNTRQNGYDISADVLGYPESYYTPPAEALKEIQIVRGAASLQYGPQFGGLINFKFKEPHETKKIEFISRQSLGSYNKFTSFNSLSGTVGKFSYYTYYNYKSGESFRPNSDYESNHAYAHFGYRFSDKTKLVAEYTFLDYLAHQPGGLTDEQFYEDPSYSNRARNWFAINWNLFAAKLTHKFGEKTDASLNIFGLIAARKALGFRENRVGIADDPDFPRELLVDKFNNWGFEARVLTRYNLLQDESVLLLGTKYYNTYNRQQQGAGPAGAEPDFTFANEEFPAFRRQSQYTFPNRNIAFFGENIFNINPKLNITPGFRIEYINTNADGTYKKTITDNADNILTQETIEEHKKYERSFALLGIGINYKFSRKHQLYANFSQNYRSVTFNDIRVVNPSYLVDPNITDEKGFTADFGLKGNFNNQLRYDVSFYGLRYDKRLGEILKAETRINAQGEEEFTGRLVRFRGNIGDSFIYGLETFIEWNISQTFFHDKNEYRWTLFVNNALTNSQYTDSQLTNVEGNKVEFIPFINLKTGTTFGYKNFSSSFQYTYLSSQYTDATNAPQDKNDSQRGIEGEIPAYGIGDLSFAYTYKRFKLETGINNIFDNSYFTRRATGYPGPGIIPAEPLTWYVTLQIKI